MVRQAKVALYSLFGLDLPPFPTANDVQTRLIDQITVNMDEMTGLVSISCRSPHINLCRDLLMAMHHAAEYRLAQMRHEQAATMLAYTDKIIPTVNQRSTLESLYQVRDDAEYRNIMATSGTPLGADIVQPPTIPIMPAFPRPALMLLIGAALGLALGLLGAVIMEYATVPARKRIRNKEAVVGA